jgi:hypothetical protein
MSPDAPESGAVELRVGESVEVLQKDPAFAGIWLPATLLAVGDTDVLCDYTELGLETVVHVWELREHVRVRAEAAASDVIETAAPWCVPAWADLGMEVEGLEVSPGFEGAIASGELVEWVQQPPHGVGRGYGGDNSPTQSERARVRSKTCASGKPCSSDACSAAGASACHPLAALGPWARIQSRLQLPSSPYSPSGRLVTERCVPPALCHDLAHGCTHRCPVLMASRLLALHALAAADTFRQRIFGRVHHHLPPIFCAPRHMGRRCSYVTKGSGGMQYWSA